MATKKTTKNNGRIKETVEKAKNDLNCGTPYTDPNKVSGETTTTTTTTADDNDPFDFDFLWKETDEGTMDEGKGKRELAKDVLIRLIDFNLKQLSRRDVDKVLIYDNPAEYAAEVVNELYKRMNK